MVYKPINVGDSQVATWESPAWNKATQGKKWRLLLKREAQGGGGGEGGGKKERQKAAKS